MSSPFAQRFNEKARPLLWRNHGETVRYHDDDGSVRDLPVIWKRINPKAEDNEGLGVDTFFADAVAVVKMADLADPHGAAEIEREGERWAIRLIELQDEWTWLLYLAHARSELRLPEGMRR